MTKNVVDDTRRDADDAGANGDERVEGARSNPARTVWDRSISFLSSYGLGVVLLLLLLALVFAGTMDEVGHGVRAAQKAYFESPIVTIWLTNWLPVFLPGGYVLLSILFVNLVLGNIYRSSFTLKRFGALVTHFGILFLLFSSFISHVYAVHGSMHLYEGQGSNTFKSYYDWEIAVYPADGSSSGGARLSPSFVPKDWTKGEGDQMRLVTYHPEGRADTECYITALPGKAGGVAANLSRWRSEFGKSPLNESEIHKLPTVSVLGGPARLLTSTGTYKDMSGKDHPGYMVVGAVRELPRVALFVKMVGPEKVVAREHSDFARFCQGLELRGDDSGVQKELVIPNDDFMGLGAHERQTFRSEDLPFDLTVYSPLQNCEPVPLSGASSFGGVDGFTLRELTPYKAAENDEAGVYVECRGKRSGKVVTGILWGRERAPLFVELGGQKWNIVLRRARYAMPFTVVLDKATEKHISGTSRALSFASEVTKIEDGVSESHRIWMNHPLRDEGYTLFQSRMGNGGSTFEVVKNPADHWPLYACIVVVFGLFLHFVPKLVRYLKAEGRLRS